MSNRKRTEWRIILSIVYSKAQSISNLHDIHPNNKETVGQRLALLALAHDYGFDIKADSPSPREWRVEGDAFVVEFDHHSVFSINCLSMIFLER